MPLIISLVVILLIIFGVIFTGFNRLVQMRNAVTRTFAQVDVILQKRANLIPALIEVTKGYAKHEKDVLISIAASRAEAQYSQDSQARVNDEVEVAKELRKLLALREAYPDLRANEEFLNLMNELEMVEGMIAEQREGYNNVVKVYNDYIGTFPTSLLAQVFGFAPGSYFEFGSEVYALPDVHFPSRGEENLIDLGPEGE